MVKTYPGTDTIEDDIRTTRQKIDDGVERIQQRLSPGDMVDSVIDFAKTNGGALAGTMRENPVPLAMIGAGVVWLALSSRARHHEEAEELTGQSGESTGEKLRHRAAAVRDGVRESASEALERAEDIGHKARIQAARAGRSGGRFAKDHPFWVGAAGIAIGAALAASLPHSAREDRAFGERAADAKRAAKAAALKEGRKIQEAAKAAVEKARDAAESKAPTAGDLKSDAASVAKAASGSKATSGTDG